MVTFLDVEVGKLEQSLGRVKAHLAWQELKVSEVPIGDTPSFQFGDSTDMDIKVEKGYFFKKAFEITDILNENPGGSSENVRKRVMNLEAELRHIEKATGL